MPQRGDRIAERYEVEEVIGTGGMGVILAARHLELGQRVAVKILRVADGGSEAIARFVREARTAVQIQSEHGVRVMDVGTLSSGAPFMVMEMLQGADLSRVLHDQGPLPVEEAVDYVLQACEAIAEAHVLGIVHRDLKPANLFRVRRLDGTPLIKVLDFGISKLQGLSQRWLNEENLTQSAAFLGSPLYVSPEQLMSAKDVDERTDIWALGAVLFELVTGQPPFEGATLPLLCMQIVHAKPGDVRKLRPDAPAGLEKVIAKCLEKAPGKRYANVAELGEALAPYAPSGALLSVRRISRVMQSVSATQSSSNFSSLVSAAEAQSGPESAVSTRSFSLLRGRGALVISAAVVVACLGVLSWILLGPSPPATSSSLVQPAALPALTATPTLPSAPLQMAGVVEEEPPKPVEVLAAASASAASTATASSVAKHPRGKMPVAPPIAPPPVAPPVALSAAPPPAATPDPLDDRK